MLPERKELVAGKGVPHVAVIRVVEHVSDLRHWQQEYALTRSEISIATFKVRKGYPWTATRIRVEAKAALPFISNKANQGLSYPFYPA